jgi:hypothetical protein
MKVRLSLGIRNEEYPAVVTVQNGICYFELQREIPVGPYAGMLRFRVENPEPWEAAGEVVNKTIAALND